MGMHYARALMVPVGHYVLPAGKGVVVIHSPALRHPCIYPTPTIAQPCRVLPKRIPIKPTLGWRPVAEFNAGVATRMRHVMSWTCITIHMNACPSMFKFYCFVSFNGHVHSSRTCSMFALHKYTHTLYILLLIFCS